MTITQPVDLEACRENVDRYATAGDARSCRDIAIAVMRENQRMRDQLDAANELLLGVIENGAWMLITDPALRQLVGEYIADTCHSIAAAAGLDEAMERAHDATPQRLATSLPAPSGPNYPEGE